jgi:hypothetical protein
MLNISIYAETENKLIYLCIQLIAKKHCKIWNLSQEWIIWSANV